MESRISNPCDGVRYCDSLQGSTTFESMIAPDDSNGGMKDDFRGIIRRAFVKETPVSVDS